MIKDQKILFLLYEIETSEKIDILTIWLKY